MEKTVEFLHTIGNLKGVRRTGWVETGVLQPESVSDHMYRVALMCMTCPDSSLNKDRLIRMALCHDVGESIIGDISPKMGVPKEEKYRMEREAVTFLSGLLQRESPLSGELQELWEEYEAQDSPEARFLRDMDLLEMVSQAHSYEQVNPELNFDSFFVSGEQIKHPWARAPLLNFIFASAQADEQFMTDVILHKLVAESLLDCGVSGAVREAILSIAGIEEEPHLAMHFRHLPAIVSKAVSSLICLSRTLSGSQEAFGAALSACQENWKRLGESLEAADGSFLRGEDVAAAAQYTSHLLEFRKLWLRLFGPSYASSGKEEVPPHMFAVNWGKVKSVESVKWMQDAERGSSCALTEIISGKAPVFTYFLYILQHTLVVRVKLLHCLAEIFENTARCVNIMEVVRHVHVARAVQQDMRRQQELWERLGLLTLQMREGPKHCHNHELQFFCNFPCVQRVDLTKGKDAPLPPLFYTQCPFIWILLGTLWDMEDRISLIFSRSLIILPSSKLSRACASVKIDSPGASGRGSLAGRSMLVNEICTSSGLTCTHEPDYADQMRREGGADARLSLLSSGVMEEEARSCRLAQPSGGFASRGVLSLIFSPWRKVLSRPADREQVDMRVPELTPPFGLDLTPCQETNLDFVAIQGCRCLSQHILNITEGYNGATLLVATNCKQRPGKRVWYNNQYTFGATTFSDASFLDGDGVGEGAIEASEASELQHWVLNFVFPKSRLSEERGQRMRQEFALLRSVALQSVGSTGHRLQFEGDKGSRFFVLRSYENMDEGRLYFALLLPFCSTKPNSTVEVSRWAFSLMESLCATWCMPNLTNLAVQLAVCGT